MTDRGDGRAREAWIESRVDLLTLNEKVTLVAGQDAWRTASIERVDIPSVKVTDGPTGARGNGEGRTTATCFPVGTALGATWDTALLTEIGAALAAEAASKGAQLLLGPTVNLHRSPLAGRNFECYSEDPHLTAQLAISLIGGLQANGTGACIKHFVANDSEFERMTISSEVDGRTLRELYLVPFEDAVAVARPWAVMAAYNRVNGVYACDHHDLLVDLLKTEWGFDGVVISDWGAVHDTVRAATGGCDLEMPGPPVHFGLPLVEAVRAGSVSESVLDDKVRRVLRLVWRSGRLDHPEEVMEASVDSPAHRALARRAAVESMVLLKNEVVGDAAVRVLPLRGSTIGRRIAVIGPNAEVGSFQGGGSSIVRAHQVVHPLAAITERAVGAAVVHDVGCPTDRYQTRPDPRWFVPIASDDDGRGWLVEYFDASEPTGPVHARRHVRSVSWAWWQPPPGLTDPTVFSARWSATFVAPVAGRWTFGLAGIGRCRLLLDGEEIVDNWSDPVAGELFFSRGSTELAATAEVEAGREHVLHIEYATEPGADLAAIRFGMTAPEVVDPVVAASAMAAEADVAIVIVGTSGDWETEGSDRVEMALPGRQNELISAVAAANPRTVVVVNTGSPIEMPWIHDVPAVVQGWFGGQEFGHAIADVLFGDADPGGRLPTTFPVRYADHPAHDFYPGTDGAVSYGEGVFMGYRGYDERSIEPLFPFGHGLSYTTFEYGDTVNISTVPEQVGPAGAPLVRKVTSGSGGSWPGIKVSVELTNSGSCAGHEVTQLFIHRSGTEAVPRPPRELRGFVKTMLAAGERTLVDLEVGPRDVAYVDPITAVWTAEAGTYDLTICSSGVEVRRASFEVSS